MPHREGHVAIKFPILLPLKVIVIIYTIPRAIEAHVSGSQNIYNWVEKLLSHFLSPSINSYKKNIKHWETDLKRGV